ncbi:MAG: hypothetical protein CVT49_10930 [candidate division Zixibacteria bacterium HGW-Zixibacteria-1]|nr:MAG: hypothetical protein CVT49_10930 [candidate division Zixibacteria bacterium HGW-Zixibacteria-1]
MTIFATLQGGCSKSVDSGPVSPTVISAAPLDASVGREYTYTVIATGNPPPIFSLAQAPEGMTIDQVSGLISWVPTSDSYFDSKVSVDVSNQGGRVSHEFVIQVTGKNIDGWETSSLVAEDIDPAAIRSIASDIEAGIYPGIKSLLIVRNGQLVFENYFNGGTRNTSLNIYSAEKSITSCLMGIAIDNGLIAGVDEPLYSFFPEYDAFDNWSAWKEAICLKHLLTMTSGFELEGANYNLWMNNIGPRDWIKFYLDLPVVFSPGKALDYKSLCDRLAGHVVERQAQTTLPQFAADRLFKPLGMAYYNWYGWNPVNSSMISGLLRLRAIDMAKVGQMYLDGGMWQGNRIVSEDWVTRSTTLFRGNYGYNWWVYVWATPVGNIRVYYAYGNGGNSIYVIEELQMVVVFTGDYFVQPDQWDQQYDLMKYQIIPAAGDSM